LGKKNRELVKKFKEKYWSSNKPEKIEEEFIFNYYCESGKCDKVFVLPVNIPITDKELMDLITKKFHYKKPMILSKKTVLNYFRKNYILFRCPMCGWEKLTKLSELIKLNIINPDICVNCEYDLCLWINCLSGGYIGKKN
jgi:hypothetical protein